MKRHHHSSSTRDNEESELTEQKRVKSEQESRVNYSLALESILSYSDLTIQDFFQNTWQSQPCLYKKKNTNTSRPSRPIPLSHQTKCPLQQVLNMGWDGVIDLLENSYHNINEMNKHELSSLHPLFLRDQTPINSIEIQNQYSYNPFAAYIDGCSIIQNHAEYFSQPIFNLCLDLQQSFPHVYCNTYLTPPNSKTVKAHADDRDVLVIQIKGKKQWKVYKHVPIPFPYHHEQVGKNNGVVPFQPTTFETALSNDNVMIIDTILEEGDVLYMPRGYVHEASTTNCNNQPSFHLTIAIMTSDWSYSKVIADYVRKCLDKKNEYRMAIPVDIGRRKDIHHSITDKFKQDLDSIMDDIKENITMESISSELHTKYCLHNEQTLSMRKICSFIDSEYKSKITDITGPQAAKVVDMKTRVRKSTLEERESVKRGDRGLTVRDNISEALLSIIGQMEKEMNHSWYVSDLHYLIDAGDDNNVNETSYSSSISISISELCALSICSFVKCCVTVGVMSIADE